jgi:hypothetical protein
MTILVFHPNVHEPRDLDMTELGSVSGGNSSINYVDGVYYMDGAYLNPETAQMYLDAERRAAEAALVDPAPAPGPEQAWEPVGRFSGGSGA